MIPASFDYTAPSTLAEAVRALADGGDDAKVLAGGHSLLPVLKLRMAAPALIVDLGNIDELRGVLDRGLVAIVADAGGFHGLITRFDLLNHLRKARR